MKKNRGGIHQIAELANVSIGTVDRALHGRDGIRESTRQRILHIAQQIGYTPNLAARALSASRRVIRIGVCIPREIRFFYDQLWSGVADEVQSLKQLGVQFEFRPVRALGEDDTKAFAELIDAGANGIIVTAGNPKGLSPLIDAAEKKGVRVVCVSTDAPESQRSTVVCVEPRLNGHLAGELMGKFVPPGSKVAVVAGMLSASDHRKKTEGFSESFPLHCAGGSVVCVVEGHEDEDESFQKTFDLLRSQPDLAGLYVNTVNCLPVCRALGAVGLAGKVKLITTDLFAEMTPYFQKGTITASIYQQPYRQGQIATRILADHLSNQTAFPPTIHLSPGVVMSANLQLFREMRSSPTSDSVVPEKALLHELML
ncbi:MAG TPA: substrate-binding domain-containing protein [Terriglobales bacterium]|nr:substrate-binding domain-containing protein [Terriglobales bacterium]